MNPRARIAVLLAAIGLWVLAVLALLVAARLTGARP